MTLVRQSFEIVDRLANRAHGSAYGQGKRGRSAVDADQTQSVANHVSEVAAINEMDAALNAERTGLTSDEA